ncbi:hypothetical protein HanIR_Chr07g0341531 [Helianthus annuus]|nr:hypothetical protein HanIR_Chr07g0341531 [Helianthus annuus]
MLFLFPKSHHRFTTLTSQPSLPWHDVLTVHLPSLHGRDHGCGDDGWGVKAVAVMVVSEIEKVESKWWY